MCADVAFCIGCEPAVGEEHIMVKLPGIAQILYSRYFFANDCFARAFRIKKITLRESLIISVRMLRLDDDGANPRSGFAWVVFRRADELSISAAIWTGRKSDSGAAENFLAYKNNQFLELIIAQVLIGKLHRY